MIAKAKRWVRISRRGLPPRREWVAPLFPEVEFLRDAAPGYGVKAGDMVRALVIHRARVRVFGERRP